MLMVDVRWEGGLFDFNPETSELTKVIKCYRGDDSVEYYRMHYKYDPLGFREANEEDIELYRNNYFNDNGEQIYK